jgi:hypothetical protein
MVGPTKRKPRAFRSREIRSESAVRAGRVMPSPRMTAPPVNDQQ